VNSHELNWKDETKLEIVLTQLIQEKKLDKYLEIYLAILDDDGLETLEDWRDLTRQQKSEYPINLVNILDSVQYHIVQMRSVIFWRNRSKLQKLNPIEEELIE
jgi:hypothetical protein